MIVTHENFSETLRLLAGRSLLAVDTETTGLRPFHGDRLFSIIVAADIGGEVRAFYFNFQPYTGVQPQLVLLPEHLLRLRDLFSDSTKIWYAHNAKFDLAMLLREGLEILGTVNCTQAIERVLYNDYPSGGYDLDSCARRVGFEKDGTVEKYIEEHKLWTYTGPEKPGKREKLKHFDQVPFNIIVPYAERDAIITYHLGQHQEKALRKIADETDKKLPSVQAIAANERRLTTTISRLEHVGVRIDKDYCVRAAHYEQDRSIKAAESFKKETGRVFSASSKLFEAVFACEKDKWEYGEPTKTGQINPSFTSEVLAKFQNPAARIILEYRDSKSKSDFYRGFLWHSDGMGVVHPTFNPAGAATGRFSSSNPNFQNLTNEEDVEKLEQEFVVRRAIIPRPGFLFYGRDWDAMEYKMMFEYACKMWGSETEIVRQLKSGKDVHQATADLVTCFGRMVLKRGKAKNGNFAELYGSGLDTLAATIGGTRGEAQALKDALREAAPEVRKLVDVVSTTARTRGFVRNWYGRRSYLRDPNFAYRMTNYLIQGGCADVNKIALNQIDEFLLGKQSRLVLTIHDEIIVETTEKEIEEVAAKMKEIMSTVFPSIYLPLTSSGFKSTKSLADMEDAA